MFVESIQHRLSRVRPPRVQITYDVEIGNAIETRELPFLMGIISDLGGQQENPLPRLRDRKFVDIDRDNFPDVLASIKPRLMLHVDNKLSNTKGKVAFELKFNSMDDFDPINVIMNVQPMADLYNARVKLSDLLGKMDGNEDLDALLKEILGDTKLQASMKSDVDKHDKDGSVGGELAKAVTKGKLVRDDSQQKFAADLISEFVKQVTSHKVVSHDSIAFISKRIAEIDEMLSAQLNEILHHPDFQLLEGSWRGLSYLVHSSETGANLKLRVLNVSKDDLRKDLERAIEFDQSALFKKVYEEEYGTFGGTPYSCLLGDFEFGRTPMDMTLLQKIAEVAAAAHAPFIGAADPSMFDLDSYTDLGAPRDIGKIFESTEMAKWRSFRESEDSRYVALVLPRVLMRLPYGSKTNPVGGINYEEDVDGTDNSKFCWANAAYALGARITDAHAHYHWTAAIRGVEGGGLVTDLPAYTFKTTDGDIALKCPTEIAITDRREKELSDQGFIALCHSKESDFAAFFGVQTAQQPKTYNTNEANANSRLSARLSYMLAASRFAHYIKVIMRDKVGTFMERYDVSKYLNTWIAQYVLITDNATQAVKASYPLREARIDVVEDTGNPGCYKATVFLRPHFQLEELTASLRLVAQLPPPAAR
jgi:type VI secretion system protein ImpC